MLQEFFQISIDDVIPALHKILPCQFTMLFRKIMKPFVREFKPCLISFGKKFKGDNADSRVIIIFPGIRQLFDRSYLLNLAKVKELPFIVTGQELEFRSDFKFKILNIKVPLR